MAEGIQKAVFTLCGVRGLCHPIAGLRAKMDSPDKGPAAVFSEEIAERIKGLVNQRGCHEDSLRLRAAIVPRDPEEMPACGAEGLELGAEVISPEGDHVGFVDDDIPEKAHFCCFREGAG